MRLAALALLLTAVPALAQPTDRHPIANPEARPFGTIDSARGEIDKALAAAVARGRHVILVFGANWCHDSRALAGWFATPRFAALMRDRYEVVWINVGDSPGEKDRNADLARRFGLGAITKTPTVLIVDANGTPMNLADAPGWSNASTRSSDAIYDYFAKR